jgi:pimeloyl-ACP methyl ester carboxylesterase
MSLAQVNGIQLFYELGGSAGNAIVLVHGSWGSHHTWDSIVPLLADSFRVLTYDRRGHSQSERPPGQGSIREDVADLAALIEHLELAPVWVVGNSQGALIALRLAGEHPELLCGITGHEPPMFSPVEDDPTAAPLLENLKKLDVEVAERIAAGDSAGGAELFVDAIVSPGAFAQLPDEYREELIHNAPTFLDEERDPENAHFDPGWLTGFPHPVLLTMGDESDPIFVSMYAEAAELLPKVEFRRLPGAGHVPQRYQPNAYADVIRTFIHGSAG